MQKLVIAIGFLVLLFGVAPWLAWTLFERQHHLSFVPEAMEVSEILYVAEESWGFGPGGNETGIIVYAMPEAFAAKLKAQGKALLETLPENRGRGWQGRYRKWFETPVESSRHWKTPGACNGRDVPWTCPGIADYMFRYGFHIPFDAEVEGLVNAALFAPGSFYAYGRIGMILLIPAERRIVYAYNG